MKLSRNVTLIIHFILDELLPPLFRDSRWVMYLPFRILFKEKTKLFMTFKEKAPNLTQSEIAAIYRETAHLHIQRKTDLNHKCIEAIDRDVIGDTILDIACGRGWLAKRLACKYNVVAADFVVHREMVRKQGRLYLVQTGISEMPFKDKSFDTVVCVHTLEHVIDITKIMSELRRVTRRRLIIVVPKQRRYSYTFDLHLQFFPHASALNIALGKGGVCVELGGDLYYCEDFL